MTARLRNVALAGTTALLLAGATACGGGGSVSNSGGSASDTLSIGLQMSIPSMNPVLSPISPTLIYAYDPLIYRTNSGSYVPDLATSWRYVGTGNKTFELTLRQGVKFADGTALTAQAVKNSIDYFRKTPNSNLASAGPIASVRAVNANTVRITYKGAFPNAVDSLTQFWGIGQIIGPKGLAKPGSLETSSDGVGQYALDAKNTRANSVYTFTAAKNYFNSSAVQYKKIEIRPYSSASARLNALKSGQIQDATQIPLGQLGSSAADGYQKFQGQGTWNILDFLNTSSGPLANRSVRQAISYAVDRSAIAKDFYAGLATPQYQFSPKGTVGYTASLKNAYPYDAAKAKKLLGKAGYGNGFTLKLLTDGTTDPGGSLAQVLKDQLAKIGITLQLTVNSGTFAQFQTSLSSGTYGVVLFNLASVDLYSTATQSIVSPKSLLNPSASADSTAMSLLTQAAGANGAADIAAKLQQLNTYLTDQALGVPLVTRTNIDLVSTSVKLPATSYVTPQPTMIGPAAAYAFASK
ncbi:ABC transporter substrate-binding protein [Streptomyces sp. NPDC002928]|uniref:ABC transporter substrate-binding protein n=1 Tax=Streptomyces sp. NPDC002928 TaxID=3154440 RepID=UPI0033A8313A